MTLFPEAEFHIPWQPVTEEEVARSLLAELERETCSSHCLYGNAIKAIARRIDCDEVLFLTRFTDRPLAVVHLTWRSNTELDPTWPYTEYFCDWKQWSQAAHEPDDAP
jgi:hypothetical protein